MSINPAIAANIAYLTPTGGRCFVCGGPMLFADKDAHIVIAEYGVAHWSCFCELGVDTPKARCAWEPIRMPAHSLDGALEQWRRTCIE